MKKIFLMVLIIGVLFVGYAESARVKYMDSDGNVLQYHPEEEMVYESAPSLSLSYQIRNNTADDISTAVSTSTIVPGIHKIIGYQVMPILGSGAGAWCSLYAGSSESGALMGETETISDTSDGEVFLYPKAVKAGGLTVHQSCYSNVVITFMR